MGRNKNPRCELCGSDRPLEFGETRCAVCKRTCSCGRLIPYSGFGRPNLMCLQCSEVRHDRRLCPCGNLVPKSRVLYCSYACMLEGARIKRGGRPRLGWAPNLHTIAKREGDHEKAAKKVLYWLQRDADKPSSIEIRDGHSIFNVYGERLYVVRATGMGFDIAGQGLPEWVPVDDEDRLTAMTPEPEAYLLLNGRRDVVFGVKSRYREKWRSETLFVHRYGGLAEVLHCPRGAGILRAIGL